MIIGIDLGTTNSAVAVYERGKARVIPVDGASTMPSVVSFERSGKVHVGRDAKHRLLGFPSETISAAKRSMGRKHVWNIHGQEYSATDISALILRKLIATAQEALSRRITEAVITVPAYFDDQQRAATIDAAKAAGLEKVRILTEPEAGAISYAVDRKLHQRIMVYDLGGGTFDITILALEGDVFTAKAIEGDSLLGGLDFDHLVAIWLSKHLEGPAPFIRAVQGYLEAKADNYSVVSAIEDPEVVYAAKVLIERAEKIKIELSTLSEASILEPALTPEVSLDATLSREQFVELIEPLIARTIQMCKHAISAAHLEIDQIDKILLVGGSTKVPAIREALKELLKEPWTSDNVDEAVAIGAAVYAAAISMPSGKRGGLPIVHTALAHSIGVRTRSAISGEQYCECIVPKNTSCPSTVFERSFSTSNPYQSVVEIAVFQGESEVWQDNTFIGGFYLSVPPREQLQEIVIGIKANEDGMLAVEARSSEARGNADLDIQRVADLDEFERGGSVSGTSIIFFVDTSGSMSGEIEGVQRSALDFAKTIEAKGMPVSLGLLDFAKRSSQYEWESAGPMHPTDFIRSPSVLGLKVGRHGYGGCYIGEPETVPVVDALAKIYPKDDSFRVAILISDETCSAPKQSDVDRILSILRENQITLFVIGVSGIGCHEQLARETGGAFTKIEQARTMRDSFDAALQHIARTITDIVTR